MAFPENPVIGQLYSSCTVDDKTVWVYTGTRWDLLVDDTWVDLTDDELHDIVDYVGETNRRVWIGEELTMEDYFEVCRAAIEVFKEKNGGR